MHKQATVTYVLVLLSTPSYTLRRELRHLQGELYRMLRTILSLFGSRSAVRLHVGLHVGLQIYLQLFKKKFFVQRKHRNM
jgi:hypothetical protein